MTSRGQSECVCVCVEDKEVKKRKFKTKKRRRKMTKDLLTTCGRGPTFSASFFFYFMTPERETLPLFV